jgi:predicted alpha-1,2-mannosidase
MKEAGKLLLLFLCAWAIQANGQSNNQKAISKVDPFWGCDGGNVFVGACSPFGMVRLGPDCPFPTPTSGYQSTKPIIGFSHTHLSGTGGGGRYGNLLVSSQFGEADWKNRASESKQNEMASPGYYSVKLSRKGKDIQTELTSNQNTGRQRITFFGTSSEKASILVDLAHTISRDPKASFTKCKFVAETDGSFSGSASFKGGWGGENPYTVFFRGQITMKNPSLSFKVDTTKIPAPLPAPPPKGKISPGKTFVPKPKLVFDTTGFAFSGMVGPNEQIETTICISFKSLEETLPAFNKALTQSFELIRSKAELAWEDRLAVIQLKTTDKELEKRMFSALYHTMIMPTDVTGHHPDDQFGEAHFWEFYTLWDTFRCLMPLHNLLYPSEQARIFRSLIRTGETLGWLPDAWIAGKYAQAQGGCNAEVVLAEAVLKGMLKGGKALEAWNVCYANATKVPNHPEWYGRQPEYLKNGFCSQKVKNCTSHSLEYAYNDHCLALMAEKLGKTEQAKFFRDRSTKVLELFYPERKFFWAKDSTGKWMPGFTPEFMRPDHWNGPYFYEGNGWTYHMGAPHLCDTLKTLMGGKQAFLSRLDSTFEGNHLDMGNEPGFLLPYTYLECGEREKSQKIVQQLLAEKFVPGRKGLPGQDDSGALSSWMFWSTLGLYPKAGTEDYYLIPPYVEEAELLLPGGKLLKIKGKGKNPFWNGKPFNGFKIKHADFTAGGTLEWK